MSCAASSKARLKAMKVPVQGETRISAPVPTLIGNQLRAAKQHDGHDESYQ